MLNPIQHSLMEGMYLCREAAEVAASEQQQLPGAAETVPQPASQQPEAPAGETRAAGVPGSTAGIKEAAVFR